MSFELAPERHEILLKAPNLRKLAQVANRAANGKTNNTGTVTLAASTTTTTVTDSRIGEDTVVLLSPLTANAAAAIGTTYISTTTAGTSFVLTHASDANVDKTFGYILVG